MLKGKGKKNDRKTFKKYRCQLAKAKGGTKSRFLPPKALVKAKETK
jgi:hypothetical protein